MGTVDFRDEFTVRVEVPKTKWKDRLLQLKTYDQAVDTIRSVKRASRSAFASPSAEWRILGTWYLRHPHAPCRKTIPVYSKVEPYNPYYNLLMKQLLILWSLALINQLKPSGRKARQHYALYKKNYGISLHTHRFQEENSESKLMYVYLSSISIWNLPFSPPHHLQAL